MKLTIAVLIGLLSAPAFAHDYRPYRERSYSYPRHRTHAPSTYTYDRPNTYRWSGDRGHYGSHQRPRFHRHWRDGSSSASKSVVPGRRSWR